MPVVSDDVEPLSFVFEDDGLVPNNPMPFLVYKGAIDVDNEHPEKTIEGLFGANGWGEMWRNGVFDYLHYHATVHEALGVARDERGGAVAAELGAAEPLEQRELDGQQRQPGQQREPPPRGEP